MYVYASNGRVLLMTDKGSNVTPSSFTIELLVSSLSRRVLSFLSSLLSTMTRRLVVSFPHSLQESPAHTLYIITIFNFLSDPDWVVIIILCSQLTSLRQNILDRRFARFTSGLISYNRFLPIFTQFILSGHLRECSIFPNYLHSSIQRDQALAVLVKQLLSA